MVAAMLGLLAKRFDWQQVIVARTCEHCGLVHSVIGKLALASDITTTISLYYLLAIPFVVAAYETAFDWRQYLTVLILFIGLTCALTLVGALLLGLLNFYRRRNGYVTALSAFLCGSRLFAIVLSSMLFQAGFSNEAVGGRIFRLLGAEAGEWLFVVLGGVKPITSAAIQIRFDDAGPCFRRLLDLSLYGYIQPGPTLYVKSCATRRKHTQLVRLELQISCSNQLSYAGAAHMKAGLASSSRVRPTLRGCHLLDLRIATALQRSDGPNNSIGSLPRADSDWLVPVV